VSRGACAPEYSMGLKVLGTRVSPLGSRFRMGELS